MKVLLNVLHLILFCVASGLGLALTSIMTWAKYSGVLLTCSNDFQCEEVLNSPWSSLLGVPVSALGLLAFSMIVCFTVIAIKGGSSSYLKFALRVSTVALLASIMFSIYSHFVIGAHCIWCLTSGLCFAVSTFALATSSTKTDTRWASGSELIVVGIAVIALGVSFGYRQSLQKEADEPACDVALAAAAIPSEVLGDKTLRWGSRTPTFSVVLFVDFECQSCHNLYGPLRRTVERRGGELIVRHYPISSHEQSFAVATAICALGEKGSQATVNLLNQTLSKDQLRAYVNSNKQSVTTEQWQESIRKVKSDVAFASTLRVRSTPCVLIVEDGKVTAVSPSNAIETVSRL